jgi:4-hydroxybenzoate polyprenyltransferase
MEVNRQKETGSNSAAAGSYSAIPPLVVDLDGTLLRTDLLHESLLRLLKQRPWALLMVPVWLLRGRVNLKRKLSELVHLNCAVLPIHEEFIEWLRSEKKRGRSLVLATASDQNLAARAVAHLELFDRVLGSRGSRNLKGHNKIEAIIQECGPEFDYAGNSQSDQSVWRASRQAILVNAHRSVEALARRSANVTRVFPPAGGRLKAMIRSLRIYQWVKNLLIFVPAFTSHEGVHGPVIVKSMLGFLALSMCASGVYVANDLLDLEEDRQHSSKRDRPFASGECSILTGVLVGGLSMSAGLALGAWIGNGLLLVLLLYVFLASLYSLCLKKMLLLDVLTLAILYTVRVIVGHVLTGILFSAWLSSFMFFLFLSLAFSKRATELIKFSQSGGDVVPGRGYSRVDLPVIMTSGICSGFISSLVLALYINSDAVKGLYRRPELLWAIMPVLLYYIGRLWVMCGRGKLDDDPIIYSAKSPSTYYVAALILVVVIAATRG